MSNITHVPDRAPHFVRLPFGSALHGALRLFAYLSFTLLLMPLQAILVAMRAKASEAFPRWYHHQCCRLLRFNIQIKGEQTAHRPTLFAANHTSYLDITILGSLIPGSFIAKAEVASWPLFGWLAKLQRTVFVDRKRHTTHHQRDELSRRLDMNQNLILFPEGTSNDGNRLKPFRSALLSVAEKNPRLLIQPVSLAYTEIHGLPMGRAFRPLLAWYGDMPMAGHLWRFACLGPVTAVIQFHEPVTLTEMGSRKELTKYCEEKVAHGLSEALRNK